jgi:hypothetical protein
MKGKSSLPIVVTVVISLLLGVMVVGKVPSGESPGRVATAGPSQGPLMIELSGVPGVIL